MYSTFAITSRRRIRGEKKGNKRHGGNKEGTKEVAYTRLEEETCRS